MKYILNFLTVLDFRSDSNEQEHSFVRRLFQNTFWISREISYRLLFYGIILELCGIDKYLLAFIQSIHSTLQCIQCLMYEAKPNNFMNIISRHWQHIKHTGKVLYTEFHTPFSHNTYPCFACMNYLMCA